MDTGAITSYIDVAQLVLYGFWFFFIGLIIYLRREDKREGYPLQSDRSERAPRVAIQGFPAMPRPKTFALAGGHSVTVPNPAKDSRAIKAAPVAPWPGAPLAPTGNPLLDGVGPASYPEREHHPEPMSDGSPMIVPMRIAEGFSVAPGDLDPRGLAVIAADGRKAGVVRELWVDRAEPQIRYLELDVAVDGGTRAVLLPITLSIIDTWRRVVRVQSLLAHQFADVPSTARNDQITAAEEDRITAYYAGGKLYAEPSRQEPLL